jgi:hypothetical protein
VTRYLVIDGPLAGEHVSFTGDNFFHRHYPTTELGHQWWDRGEPEVLVYHKFKVAFTTDTRWEYEFVYATNQKAVDDWCQQLTKKICRGEL